MSPAGADGGGQPPNAGIRAEILASWQRSDVLGIKREGAELPVESDLDPDSRLLRAATPVLERLRHRLSGAPITLALVDAEANIVERWGSVAGLELMDAASLVQGANVDERFMGTSSVSMVLSTREPFMVVGQEHFLHNLQVLTCMAVPVRDPVSGNLQGAVNLSVPTDLGDPGMALMLQNAADRIGERLLEMSAASERDLLGSFLRARGRGEHARLDLGSGELDRPGGAAAPDLAPRERLALLDTAIELISSDDRALVDVELAGGRVATLRRKQLRHGDAEGASIEVSFQDDKRTSGARAATATAPDGRNVPLLDASAARPREVREETGVPDTPTGARGEPSGEPSGRPDAWLLLVGEAGVGRLAVEARGRLSMLNEAGVRIGTTLDVRRTCEELAHITVPRLADVVVVDLVESVLAGEEPPPGPLGADARLRRVAVWTGDRPDGSGTNEAGAGGAEALVRYPVGTAQARCLGSGHPVADSVLTAALAAPSSDSGHPVELLGDGAHSYMGAPLCARGVILGLAGFYRRGSARSYEEDDLALAGELTARTAISVDNARRFGRERDASLTLQRSLLPRDMPRLATVDLASRYVSADAGVGVGGNWFDAIPLSGMRVALVVGGVPGHGLQAAATMGRLRTAVHTLAGMDLLPEEVLAHLDDLVERPAEEQGAEPDPARGATCLYAVYDPVSRNCTAARAGHPLPAVVLPDGDARLLELPSGPPLGFGGSQPYESATVELPAGSLVALYTDGLVKEEGRALSASGARTARLLTALRDPDPSLDRICDRITGELLPGGPHDDVALLLARVHPLPRDRMAYWELPADPSVVAGARALVRRQLADWDLSELEYSTGLVVSELVTNAVRYGGRGPVSLRLLRDETLICEVSDCSNSSPRIRRAATTEEGGRGLYLVAQYTRSWGARYMPEGKTVWAEQMPAAEQRTQEADEETLLAMFDDLG